MVESYAKDPATLRRSPDYFRALTPKLIPRSEVIVHKRYALSTCHSHRPAGCNKHLQGGIDIGSECERLHLPMTLMTESLVPAKCNDVAPPLLKE